MKKYHINSLSRRARKFFLDAHRETNHVYEPPHRNNGVELTYDFHLDLVADIVRKYAPLVGLTEYETELAIAAAYGHDSVSDARLTFNDIFKALGDERLAQICCNLCEDVWGRNREERNSPGYYARLRSDYISVFVKLCDRIANIEYGLWKGGTTQSMPVKYLVEHKKFIDMTVQGANLHAFSEVLQVLMSLCIEVDRLKGFNSDKAKMSEKLYGDAFEYATIFRAKV